LALPLRRLKVSSSLHTSEIVCGACGVSGEVRGPRWTKIYRAATEGEIVPWFHFGKLWALEVIARSNPHAASSLDALSDASLRNTLEFIHREKMNDS
jgi:hypothetical protein